MTPPSKIPYKARLKAAERRLLIEQAAATLFAARGYEASSVAEIARAAGITKRVLYDHFPSKRDLHVSLLRANAAALLGAVAAGVTDAQQPREQLAAGVEAFFDFVQHNRYAWRMLFRDPPTDPVVAQAHREVQQAATAAIAELLTTIGGITGPPSRPNLSEMVAEHLKAGINGLAGWWYEHPEIPRDEVVAVVLELTWRGLGELTGPGAGDDAAAATPFS